MNIFVLITEDFHYSYQQVSRLFLEAVQQRPRPKTSGICHGKPLECLFTAREKILF